MKKIILGIMLLMSSLMFFGCNNNAASEVTSWVVTFESNGGTAVTGITAANDTLITAPTAPTKTGYTFSGWYKESALTTVWDFSADKVTANTTLYAKWTAVSTTTWTVTFDSATGSAVAPIIVTKGTTMTAPTVPTRTGYTFGGWYKDTSATLWDFTNDIVTADMTLHAIWTSSWTVTYAGNGGDYYGVATKTRTVANNALAPEPVTPSELPIPIRTGYTVVGWYQDSACTIPWDFTTNTVTSDITLYPKWVSCENTDS